LIYLIAILAAIEDSDCDLSTIQRVKDGKELPGALWHIYNPRDADKIRDLINRVLKIFFLRSVIQLFSNVYFLHIF